MRRSLRFAMFGALVFLPGLAVAQQAAPTPAVNASVADSGCGYVTCALRVDVGRNGPRLMRGHSNMVAAELGGLQPPSLDLLFAGNDSAMAYGARYVRAERVNRMLTFGGIIAGAVGLAEPDRKNSFAVGGLLALAASLPFQHVAQRSLGRAVWWYNVALVTSRTGER